MCEGEKEPINPSDSKSFANLKECLVDIKCWMTQNFLSSCSKIPGLCYSAPSNSSRKEEERETSENQSLKSCKCNNSKFLIFKHKLLFDSLCLLVMSLSQSSSMQEKPKQEQTVTEQLPWITFPRPTYHYKARARRTLTTTSTAQNIWSLPEHSST